MELFNKPISPSCFEEDFDDQLNNKEWIVKKYALKIILRLYLHSSIEEVEEKIPFFQTFCNEIAPAIQANVIQFLASLRNSGKWIHPRVSSLCLKYLHKWQVAPCILFRVTNLNCSIEFAVTYKTLKENFAPLLQQVIFPFLTLDKLEQERFEEDPVEFVRMEYGLSFFCKHFFS